MIAPITVDIYRYVLIASAVAALFFASDMVDVVFAVMAKKIATVFQMLGQLDACHPSPVASRSDTTSPPQSNRH